MSPRAAVFGSIVFFAVAPAVVSGVVPWLISGWTTAAGLPVWWPIVAVLGWLLISSGVAVLVAGFARFVTQGRGTPAPVAPPTTLVTGGMFAWVRNPMYVANLAVIAGQAAVLGRGDLLVYGVVVGLTMFGFVRFYEEPALAATFGGQYADYRRRVPGWWPRSPQP